MNIKEMTNTLIGKTLEWQHSDPKYHYNLKEGKVVEVKRVWKKKAEVLLQETSTGHFITMDIYRVTMENLLTKGEYYLGWGMTIKVK